MFTIVRFLLAVPPGRMHGAVSLTGPVIALGAALSASAALAGSDYPPGLFENSPVVPHGHQPGDDSPPAPDDAAPPGPGQEAFGPPTDVAPDPYGAEAPPPGPIAPAPPRPYNGPPPWASGPSDYCAGIAARTFATLDEVRRAHARCDRALNAPLPRGYPPAPGY
jgi:hypothetical protein